MLFNAKGNRKAGGWQISIGWLPFATRSSKQSVPEQLAWCQKVLGIPSLGSLPQESCGDVEKVFVNNMGLSWRRAPLQLFHNDPIDVLYILLLYIIIIIIIIYYLLLLLLLLLLYIYIPTSDLMILSITFPTSELVNSVNTYTTMEQHHILPAICFWAPWLRLQL